MSHFLNLYINILILFYEVCNEKMKEKLKRKRLIGDL
jgi:hypothetical protein